MNRRLRGHAAALLAAAPCSVEMPAGTGKTHLLGTAAAVAAEEGRRSLVLTHTNAGVDAIRKRLRKLGVPPAAVRVDTLTSWAFTLSRSYSTIAGVMVSELPDWTQSKAYLAGAGRVSRAKAIAEMHATSFDYLFVDEYQDCSLVLHDFVLALAKAIPRTVVLGDRLQGIFTFDGPMASWDHHVLKSFPQHHIPVYPHRWTDHNAELGAWLLETRALFTPGKTFDFERHDVNGLSFVQAAGPTALAQVAHSFRDFDETVVLLDKWPRDVAGHASRLGGNYTVMEDISGNFMRDMLSNIPAPGDPQIARWFAVVAKGCVIGLAGVDGPVLSRLARGETVSHYQREGISEVLAAFDALLTTPTYEQVAVAFAVVRNTPGLRVYRWEAWNDTREALSLTATSGEPPLDNLARVRDRIRRSGRRSESRIASRTLLVKGLEYDHVIIADLDKMTDPCNLYVALSRARKSVTILGSSPRIVLRAGD
ncbi:UvrD-helicase domain-containing protein [Geodermatophilus sp. DSM 44513]|uniref:UvrD-helicase domain-containing protein n=1 Tax=Geodermatophilus sp. DSM 44513 TaxID=1528104 RepID=UPI0012859C98|nr:UvrD-helicase domain-containing protein [Geodermatophilus sp. DSM 44513]WNV75148.1 UvrD-helicase domain-containing protein [Geodermatophilus sp. DSM 44513]